MGLSLDGLASGLDTTALIKALMDVESLPQLQLKKKVNTSQILTATLQNLNSKIASLGDLAKEAAKPQALALFTATSSSELVTTTTSAGATGAELDFMVNHTAEEHSAVSAPIEQWATSPATLTVTGSDGTRIEVTANSTSLDDVVRAVNNSAAGVSATKVSAGTDSVTGSPVYRLQFTSKESGTASAFQIHRGSIAEVEAGTATDLFSETGAAVIQQGQDAEITLYAGTAAEQVVTSATNTFNNVLPDVAITLAGVPAETVTLTVARDDKAVSAKAEELVKALNSVFSYIKAQSAVTTGANSNGGAVTSGGVLLGDSTVRMVEREIMAAATAPVNGRSPSEVGIEITKDGTVKFDAEKLAKSLADDPAHAETTLQAIASRVDAAAVNASDKYEGLLSSKITGQENLARSLNDQILNWDKRLAAREATLKKVYSSLEVLMSNMNSQMSWLSSQLASLPTSASSNK